jgi:hypothetical protein
LSRRALKFRTNLSISSLPTFGPVGKAGDESKALPAENQLPERGRVEMGDLVQVPNRNLKLKRKSWVLWEHKESSLAVGSL